MRHEFFGPWTVEVFAKVALFRQRFRIRGSDSSDGVYPGDAGVGIPRVTGLPWTLELEWYDDLGAGWQPSAVRRTTSYTVGRGLVDTLGADDNFDAERDHDHDDLVIVCKYLDLDPIPIVGAPFSFQLPPAWWGDPAVPPKPKPKPKPTPPKRPKHRKVGHRAG